MNNKKVQRSPAIRRSRSMNISPQFGATRNWNQIVVLFYKSVPRLSERSSWLFGTRTPKDAFTAKHGIDTLMNILPQIFVGRQLSRNNGYKVLEKFINDRLIEIYPESADNKFNDDEKSTFRFVASSVPHYIRTTTPEVNKTRCKSNESMLNRSASKLRQVTKTLLRSASTGRQHNCQQPRDKTPDPKRMF